MERFFDIFLSGLALMILAPLMIPIGLVLRFSGEEDIMYGKTASVDFYDDVIAPYKGALGEWFVLHKSLKLYFLSIFVTVWAVLIPSSLLVWKVFKGLPEPPKELKSALNFYEN